MATSYSLFAIKCHHSVSCTFVQHKHKKLSAANPSPFRQQLHQVPLPQLRTTQGETHASHNTNHALIHQQPPTSKSLFLPESSISLIPHIIRTAEVNDNDQPEIEPSLPSAIVASMAKSVNIPDRAKAISVAATNSNGEKNLTGPHCIWPRPKPTASTATPAPRCAWPRPSPQPLDGPKCAWPRMVNSVKKTEEMASRTEQTIAHGPRCPWPRAVHAIASSVLTGQQLTDSGA